jgi:hypothetical protein
MKRTIAMFFLGFSMFFAVGAFAQPAETLTAVKKVFVEKMDNDLDQFIVSAISKKFHGTLTVVLDKANADAILRAKNDQQSTIKATVELVDPTGRIILWSGTASDKNKIIRKHEGDERIGNALMDQLRKAMGR